MEASARELEIARMREVEKKTFRVIGSQFGISGSYASKIYHHLQRKRRKAKRWLLSQPENQVKLSLSLTRGELLVLEKILSSVLDGKLDSCLQIESHDFDPDYLTAKRVRQQFLSLL